MSSAAVFEFLLDPLVVVYGEPKTANVPVFLKEYATLMADFSHEELQHAKSTIMRSHEYRSFPTPAECLKACELARKELSPLWGAKVRSAMEMFTSLRSLDGYWENEVAPRRNQVSKATFEAVRMYANQRARELSAAGNITDRMTGEGG